MFGNITKQEIDTTQSIISAPLRNFLDFRDFCSTIHLNYEFLSSAGHNIPELTRIDSFMHSIQPFTQFDPYLTTWTTSNALGTRTFLPSPNSCSINTGTCLLKMLPAAETLSSLVKAEEKANTRAKTPKAEAGAPNAVETPTATLRRCPHLTLLRPSLLLRRIHESPPTRSLP